MHKKDRGLENLTSPGLGGLVRQIKPTARWETLLLPQAQLSQLKDICNQARYHFQDAGNRKPLPGKGFIVVLCGAPGSGKTMAAGAIANDLHLDLYRVDLSTVVSRYIGETEKSLSVLFREAEDSNAILFFDEADALFGKRTEVHDAHDHSAALEVNFLLQKIEAYQGVVLLATNLPQKVDEIRLGRIRFVVEFPPPREKTPGDCGGKCRDGS